MADAIDIPAPAHLSLAGLSEETARLAERARKSVAQIQVGQRGIGSAIIWETGGPDSSGMVDATVITNAHVVAAGRSERLTLKLSDGREIEGRLVALDPERDLAALRAHARDLTSATAADSSALRVGELVMAVGNPLGVEGAATLGVVAAHAPVDPDLDLEPAEQERGPMRPRHRMARLPLVQADIRLYPGNSGGPLLDARGRVIGVNTMVGGGMGFAVPSNAVARFLRETGRSGQRAYLGVGVQSAPLSEGQRVRLGVASDVVALVTEVEPGGPADVAGILVGDALLAVDGRAVTGAESLVRLLNRPGAAGQTRALEVLRGGQRQTITLTPALRDAA
ncbi:MAG TPA: trypsin-like peptidase domain-containing protein [Ktedonobacterales bacterium]